MSSGLGPFTWENLRILDVPPRIAGREMINHPPEWRASHPGSPPGIQSGAGTTLRQLMPVDRLAPRAVQQSFTLAALAVDEGDWDHLLAVRELGEPWELYIRWPQVDTIRIREAQETAVRTHWQTSRAIPLDLDPVAFVRAEIVDTQGSPSPAGVTPLTVIGSGVPGPGEILVPEGERVREVVTEDLVPLGPYRQLRLVYQPIHSVTVQNGEMTADPLSLSWELLEDLPAPPNGWRATA